MESFNERLLKIVGQLRGAFDEALASIDASGESGEGSERAKQLARRFNQAMVLEAALELRRKPGPEGDGNHGPDPAASENPQLTRAEHEVICSLMFDAALLAGSRVYVAVDEVGRSGYPGQLSLITEEMVDYDLACFSELAERREASPAEAMRAIGYRPYFFLFRADPAERGSSVLSWHASDTAQGRAFRDRVWQACQLVDIPAEPMPSPDSGLLAGDVLCAASPVRSYRRGIKLDDGHIADQNLLERIEKAYNQLLPCSAPQIERTMQRALGRDAVFEHADVFTVGNGNCIEMTYSNDAAVGNEKRHLLNDIGFELKRSNEVFSKARAKGAKTFDDAASLFSPDLVIISHWHMDHVIGCTHSSDDVYDCPWIVPDFSNYVNKNGRLPTVFANARRVAAFLYAIGNLRMVANDQCGKMICRIHCKGGHASLYRGKTLAPASRAINDNGLIFAIQQDASTGAPASPGSGTSVTAVFPGDSIYSAHPADLKSQVDDCAYLVVPHHCRRHSRQGPQRGSNAPSTRHAIVCTIDDSAKIAKIMSGGGRGGEETDRDHLLELGQAGFPISNVHPTADACCCVRIDLRNIAVQIR